MGRGVYGAILKVLRAENVPCTVCGVWMHMEVMRAIRVSSPDFIRSHQPAEGEYLRCWLPDPNRPGRQVMRNYTMVDIDYENGEFTLLFLLHQPPGPGCLWATGASVGDTFEASYYGSFPFSIPEPSPRGFVFIADAASIPYVNALAAQLADKFPLKVWMLDWCSSHHDIPVKKHDNISIEWVEPRIETLLEKAKNFSWEGWFPHLVCESKILLDTRRYLMKEAGVEKDFMHAHAYWVRGKAMGAERDERS